MAERFLYVPTDYVEQEVKKPVLFLAGPNLGAEDWQAMAIEVIHQAVPQVIIANPRKEYPKGQYDSKSQRDWETYHLERAGANGVIMFWFAKEKEHLPDRAFAQTSRLEFGIWITEYKYNPATVKLVVGIEPGFTGEEYIESKFEPYPEVPVLSTFEETCQTAIDLLRQPTI